MTTRRPKQLPYIKTVRSRGKTYEYFRTGKTIEGKELLKPLPPRSDRSFYQVHAGMVAARHARENVPASPTMRELSRAYQKSKRFEKLSVSSQNTYVIYIKRIEDEMGDAPVTEVERRDVRALLAKMEGFSGAANMTLLVMRNLFSHAIRNEWVKASPCDGIEKEEGSGEEHEPWPLDLLEQALADPAMRLPVGLLYYSAQRIGDVCRMRWSDLRDGYLYVKQEKTGKELDIRLHAELARLLAEQPRTTLTMLSGPKGRPLSKLTLRKQLQRWAAVRGQHIVPHGLRKNAVNALLEAGCSVAETSAISGQSMAMVEHYAKRRDSRKLGSAAILKWEGTERENGKQGKTG